MCRPVKTNDWPVKQHKMKKFTFKGVLDGFRSSVGNQPTKNEPELIETLRPEQFHLARVSEHFAYLLICGPRSLIALGYQLIFHLSADELKNMLISVVQSKRISIWGGHGNGQLKLFQKISQEIDSSNSNESKKLKSIYFVVMEIQLFLLKVKKNMFLLILDDVDRPCVQVMKFPLIRRFNWKIGRWVAR